MRVGKDETLGGIRLIVIRDFLRWIDGGAVEPANIAERLGLDQDRANALYRAMIEAKYIEIDTEAQREHRYVVSELGSQLRNARFLRRITRSEAEKLIDGLLDRVRQVNERDELTHRVTCIRVFGSYLTESADLGDIDLAVKYTPRRKSHVEEAKERAAQSGKSISTYFQLITFGRQEVRLILKNRSPYLSLHDFDEPETLGIPFKVLFGQA
ncbi:hypothetical protein [Bradyrhizobium liaoningense]|uniref:hypothetical protein n=1 Tax=Bradyrhizobium liaoningense TaxID=43992 RepID=UPI001BAE4089|nr:hypothetical protein [Bradyrhizobium liaoningense]MBR1168630.1 hypothetical protein [Bradyrhizobium liaoningense]